MQFYVVRHPGVVMAETRVSVCLTPGCQHVQHPGVGVHETRVSYNLILPNEINLKPYD